MKRIQPNHTNDDNRKRQQIFFSHRGHGEKRRKTEKKRREPQIYRIHTDSGITNGTNETNATNNEQGMDCTAKASFDRLRTGRGRKGKDSETADRLSTHDPRLVTFFVTTGSHGEKTQQSTETTDAHGLSRIRCTAKGPTPKPPFGVGLRTRDVGLSLCPRRATKHHEEQFATEYSDEYKEKPILSEARDFER